MRFKMSIYFLLRAQFEFQWKLQEISCTSKYCGESDFTFWITTEFRVFAPTKSNIRKSNSWRPSWLLVAYSHLHIVRNVFFVQKDRTASFCVFVDTAQQIQNICITFIQRRPIDAVPTLYKCSTNGLRRLAGVIHRLGSGFGGYKTKNTSEWHLGELDELFP